MEPALPNKEGLLHSIRPDMKLTKGFFKRVYGYEISFPGFAEQAIDALEAAGCSKARQYYEDWVNTYKTAYEAEIKTVSAWYGAGLEGKQKGREVSKARIGNMSSRELLKLLKSLTAGA